jgi:hypothetical protein
VDLSPDMDDDYQRPSLWLGDDKAATNPTVADDVAASSPLDALRWAVHPIIAFYSGGWSNLANTCEVYDNSPVVSGWRQPPGAKNWTNDELTQFFRRSFQGVDTYDLVYNVYNLHSAESEINTHHIGLHPGVQEPTMDVAIAAGLFQKVLEDVRALWEARLGEGSSSRPDPNSVIKVLFMCKQGYDIYNGGLDI